MAIATLRMWTRASVVYERGTVTDCLNVALQRGVDLVAIARMLLSSRQRGLERPGCTTRGSSRPTACPRPAPPKPMQRDWTESSQPMKRSDPQEFTVGSSDIAQYHNGGCNRPDSRATDSPARRHFLHGGVRLLRAVVVEQHPLG